MEIEVPDRMSPEGRAQMIAEEINRIDHAGQPDKRRAHVMAHALAHIRAAVLQAANIPEGD